MTGTATGWIERSSIGLFRVVISWTSGASGSVIADFDDKILPAWEGYIDRIVTSPDTDSVPTAYTVRLFDAWGVDILDGRITSRSTTAVQCVWANRAVGLQHGYCNVIANPTQFVVTSAGVNKSGVCVFYAMPNNQFAPR